MKKKHKISIHGEDFEVDVKYAPVKVVGEGADGLVCSCLNVETGGQVAVKKIRDPFRKRLQSMMVLREMQILRQVGRHNNVVSVSDVMLSSDANDVYLVQELMDMDLLDVLQFSAEISDSLCRRVLHQTLLGVSFLHSAGVMHRDLKPENLLINKANLGVKIGDFGHACKLKSAGFMTDRVGTTLYKAPEVLYGSTRYTKAVDIWSVGCIFGLMLGDGRPMFRGEGTVGQIDEIIRVLGTPSDLSYVEGEVAKEYLEGLPYSRGVRFRQLYPLAHSLAIDLLQKMVEFDPRKRITAEEALRHPYLAGLAPKDVAAPLSMVVNLELDEDDPELVDVEKVREMIRQEVFLYQPASQEIKQPTYFHPSLHI